MEACEVTFCLPAPGSEVWFHIQQPDKGLMEKCAFMPLRSQWAIHAVSEGLAVVLSQAVVSCGL